MNQGPLGCKAAAKTDKPHCALPCPAPARPCPCPALPSAEKGKEGNRPTWDLVVFAVLCSRKVPGSIPPPPPCQPALWLKMTVPSGFSPGQEADWLDLAASIGEAFSIEEVKDFDSKKAKQKAKERGRSP